MNEVAERHRALAAAVRAYLDGPLRALPLGRRLGPRVAGAAVLVTGGHALGAAGAAAAWNVEIVLAAEEWTRLVAQARASELSVLDPSVAPPADVRVRDVHWLRARLAEPAGLWLRQRAAVVQDPGGLFAPAVREALAAWPARMAAEVEARYRAFREGFETADAAREPLGRAVLLGRAAEAALALPLLARGEPYPPPEWLAWHVRQVCPDGEEIADLAARAAAQSGGPRREPYAALRRLVDDALEQAGYGERLVRAYRTLA